MTFGINGLPDVKIGRYLTIFVTFQRVTAIKKTQEGLFLFKASGAVKVNRTPDLLITNQLLYQLSYNGIINQVYGSFVKKSAVNQLCSKSGIARH
ncbi:MAG: hypothetical protein RL571_71 [Pseudomonadota bacterium]